MDLSQSEIYKMQEPQFDVNATILDLFRHIERLSLYLQKTQEKLFAAFRSLERIDHGKLVLDAAQIDYRLVDVFAARAIEANLVGLGELYRHYQAQPENTQTLPNNVVRFLGQLNQDVRKKAAHETNIDNEEWHYSPLTAQNVLDMMKEALRLFEELQNAVGSV